MNDARRGGTRCPICGCPDRRWLRTRLVARQFDCSNRSIRRLIKRGELDGVRFGGEWRVDHESIDQYVARDSVRHLPRGQTAT